MDAERYAQIKALFNQAVELPEPERLGFVEQASGDDQALRDDVLEMLREDTAGNSFFDRGLPEIAYQLLESPAILMDMEEVGPYRLLEPLGQGGMGDVWLAERVDAGNRVAMKFLLHAGLSAARLERFTSEIKTQAKLEHPFIARFHDAGVLDERTPWLVMEYVEGEHLDVYCLKHALPIEKRLRLFRSVCEAVQYAHRQLIIHRDLKPSNIMVAEDGSPRLLDFGIAKELDPAREPVEYTTPGLRFISWDYAAPEWIRDGTQGVYTDVYSLGVILYQLITGQLPFDRSKFSTAEFERHIAENDPEKPSIKTKKLTDGQHAPTLAAKLDKSEWHELDLICLKAMHRDVNQRYKTVEALMRDVDHFLAGEPLEARPDTLLYRTSKFIRRNRVPVLSTSAAIVLIVCVVTIFTVRLAKARNAAVAEASRAERIHDFMLNLFQGVDKDAGPAGDLRVVTLIDRGVADAQELGKEPKTQADLYQTLGTMYERLGKMDKADALLQSALKERQSLPEQNTPAVADNLIALGLLRADQGKGKEAEQLVRQGLAMIDPSDPRTGDLNSKAHLALGDVMVQAGKYQQAVEILKQVEAAQSKEDASSPGYAKTLRTLADAQTYLGNYSQSDSLNQRAMAIDRKVFGDASPQVSDDFHNLAQLQALWGHYQEAEQDERKAIQISRAWYGNDHPDVARKLAELADTLAQESKYREADDSLRQALPIVRNAYGETSPHVAYVLNSLGTVASYEGKYKDAEGDYQRMAEIYRASLGDGDYRVAVAMGNLASVYFKEKDYPRTERLLREVVERFTKALSADNINTGQTDVRLGRTLLRERRYAEAEPFTRTGYEVLVKQTSSSSGFVQGARHDLVEIYTALKRPEEAQKYK